MRDGEGCPTPPRREELGDLEEAARKKETRKYSPLVLIVERPGSILHRRGYGILCNTSPLMAFGCWWQYMVGQEKHFVR
jgi:hypothetical protein